MGSLNGGKIYLFVIKKYEKKKKKVCVIKKKKSPASLFGI